MSACLLVSARTITATYYVKLIDGIDFILWTITTALFNELNITAAAKGSPTHNPIVSNTLTEPLLATLPFVFLFYLFYDIAYTPMLVAYTLEILPFNIRAKGFAIMVRILPTLSEQSSDAEQSRTSSFLLLWPSINSSILGLWMLLAGAM